MTTLLRFFRNWALLPLAVYRYCRYTEGNSTFYSLYLSFGCILAFPFLVLLIGLRDFEEFCDYKFSR